MQNCELVNILLSWVFKCRSLRIIIFDLVSIVALNYEDPKVSYFLWFWKCFTQRVTEFVRETTEAEIGEGLLDKQNRFSIHFFPTSQARHAWFNRGSQHRRTACKFLFSPLSVRQVVVQFVFLRRETGQIWNWSKRPIQAQTLSICHRGFHTSSFEWMIKISQGSASCQAYYKFNSGQTRLWLHISAQMGCVFSVFAQRSF